MEFERVYGSVQKPSYRRIGTRFGINDQIHWTLFASESARTKACLLLLLLRFIAQLSCASFRNYSTISAGGMRL